MENTKIMKRFEAFYNLEQYLPNYFFLHELFVILAFNYLLKHVPVVCVLHHYAVLVFRLVWDMKRQTLVSVSTTKRQGSSQLTIKSSLAHQRRLLYRQQQRDF